MLLLVPILVDRSGIYPDMSGFQIDEGIELIERNTWEFNATIQIIADENITILPALPFRIPHMSDLSYSGILPKSLMNLVVEAMFSGWIAVLACCLTLYSLRRSFVWSRRKTLLISVLTIVGGVSLTLISWFHQVTHTMLGWHIYDASYIFYGYPFVWFKASWGYFAPPNSHWQYEVQPYGLVGNIAFYMWLTFGSLIGIMILHKRVMRTSNG